MPSPDHITRSSGLIVPNIEDSNSGTGFIKTLPKASNPPTQTPSIENHPVNSTVVSQSSNEQSRSPGSEFGLRNLTQTRHHSLPLDSKQVISCSSFSRHNKTKSKQHVPSDVPKSSTARSGTAIDKDNGTVRAHNGSHDPNEPFDEKPKLQGQIQPSEFYLGGIGCGLPLDPSPNVMDDLDFMDIDLAQD